PAALNTLRPVIIQNMLSGPHGQKDEYAYPTISFKSWESGKEVALQQFVMEFVLIDLKRARLIIEALSSLVPVTIRVPKERETEFAEKVKEFGALISN